MKLWMIPLIIGLVLMLITQIEAKKIGFIEDFSLSDDRAKALEKLIPGTEEYYFYHCLHAQNTGDFNTVESLLKKWIERYGYTEKVNEIQNRQALLTYEENPKQSLKHIKETLNLHFNHHREQEAAHSDLPASLDPKLISIPELTRKALFRYKNLKGIENAGLDRLEHAKLDPERRRDFLHRLKRPDIPGLARLVTDDLAYRHSGGFGSHPVHSLMLKSQLDECIDRMPALLENSTFINVYLTKLAPDDDTHIEDNIKEKQAYIKRMWAFVRNLQPVHNSLKAHVLYHLLDFNRTREYYDRNLFEEYVRLPRNVLYIEPKYSRRKEFRHVQANLNADFSTATRYDRVGDDTELVKDYLSVFFVSAKNYDVYRPYILDAWLQRVFAETKIVNGIGDMEEWYSMMNPNDYRRLKDRIDIEFAPHNPEVFGVNENVRLALDIKNVKTLIVKIFEINALNYYRTENKEVDTSISLDGLAATWEQVMKYAEPPLRRVRRTFEFPEMDHPGIYIVEFIGNGKSSRALIRKGKLSFTETVTAAGHEFTVFDETLKQCPKATLFMAGREYKTDEDGVITVPFSTFPNEQNIILQAGDRVSLARFQHLDEAYRLSAGFHTDAASLIRGAKAQVIIRPRLTLNGYPVSLSLLEDVRLELASTDAQDVVSTRTVPDFKLFEDKDAVFEFQVPEEVWTLRFTLKGKVKNLSLNKDEDLSVHSSFTVNGAEPSQEVYDLYLGQADGGYTLDVLGKNGEPGADVPVHLTIKHRFFKDKEGISLKTGADGRIQLGRLENIEYIQANMPNFNRKWFLKHDRVENPKEIHVKANTAFRVACADKADNTPRLHYALLERRGATYVTDRIDSVAYREGFLEIAGLPPGDYELFLKDAGQKIRIRVTDGAEEAGFLVSAHRILEINNIAPLQIVSTSTTEQEIRLQLAYTSEFTRVHLVATRFEPAFDLYKGLEIADQLYPRHGENFPPHSLYIAMRDIGDEYRYVLERKYAEKFPGNILERPEILLNPWSIRKTGTDTDKARKGEKPGSIADAMASMAGGKQDMRDRISQGVSSQSLDFLKHPTVILANLKPDENGVVTIQREKLGAHRRLFVLAADPFRTAYREVDLGEAALERRDLRMARKFDPETHFTEQKRISIVEKGDTFRLEEASTSEFEIYDTLEKAYQLLLTLSSNADLKKFAFITRWPELSEDEKQEKYSEYACHELSFFLFHKDKPFFKTVVLPYLANKKDKTFMDHWLLKADLSEYKTDWAFGQLNFAEKILLLGRGKEAGPYSEKHFDLLPPDPDAYNRLFDTAIRGRAFEEGAYGATGAAMSADNLEMDLDLALEEAPAPMRASARRDGIAFKRETAKEYRASMMDDEVGAPSMAFAEKMQAAPAPPPAAKAMVMAKKKMALRQKSVQKRQAVRRFYQKLDKTEEWAENNYYHQLIEQQNAELIQVNAFWNDFAASDSAQPFYSANFIYATRNFAEIMLALSVLDLPFKAETHDAKTPDGAFELKAGSPLIVFHKEIRQAEESEANIPVMAAQNFFRTDDTYEYIGNERYDKFVKGEFLYRTPYGCQVAVTNPTSTPRKLRVLLQIPRGALPLSSGFYSRGIPVNIKPYGTWTYAYYFYFPEPGTFGIYPAQTAQNEAFVAGAEAVQFTVVKEFSKIDTESWAYLSQNGSDRQVLDYIRTHNPNRIDLDKIAFRMRKKGFFKDGIDLLRSLRVYNHTLWSYGIYHNAPDVIREYLSYSPYADACGLLVSSPILTLDPVERKTYQHLEYKPLINARAHRLGSERKILNDRFYDQYQRFMQKLSYEAELTPADQLAAVYYLLLQDRVGEALKRFEKIDPERLASRMQYDYLQIYLDFYADETSHARKIAARYADCPVPKWQKRFQNALSQLDELDGKSGSVADDKSREQVQDALADTEPALNFSFEARKITLNYRNLESCTVNYYPMEIELLFSRNPFVKEQSGDFANIRPSHTERISLKKEETRHEFVLPEKFHNSNLMVEITAGGLRKSKAYYANSLNVQMIETYGQLKVRQEETGKPLPETYVKVYARMYSGDVQFYKDGYTDLRGRFDYVSLSTDELDRVNTFAVLVMHDEFGAVIKEADPPKR